MAFFNGWPYSASSHHFLESSHRHISFFSFFFLKQALASFIKEKLYMIYFSPVCSGMLLIISESPGSMIASVHTL